MKEKLRKIMYGGGYAIIIAVVAMVAYLTVMYFANKYFEDSKGKIEINVSKEGNLSVNYEGDDSENIYVLWETDGGTIKPVKENEKFSVLNQSENNRFYYTNTHIKESVIWDNLDYTGDTFKKATVKAVLYRYNKDQKKDYYYMGDYITEVNITLTKNNDKIIKTADRYFSNPEKEDSENNNWSEIYIIEENDKTITLRYRTGGKTKDELLLLSWESDDKILNETDYALGFENGGLIYNKNKNVNFLKAKTTITLLKENIMGKKIEAFLTDEKTYNKIDDNKTPENEKKYKSEFSYK